MFQISYKVFTQRGVLRNYTLILCILLLFNMLFIYRHGSTSRYSESEAKVTTMNLSSYADINRNDNSSNSIIRAEEVLHADVTTGMVTYSF